MTNEINLKYLQISGRFEIEQPLLIDQDYSFTVTGSIVKVEDKSTQGEYIDQIYTLKPIQVLPVEL